MKMPIAPLSLQAAHALNSLSLSLLWEDLGGPNSDPHQVTVSHNAPSYLSLQNTKLKSIVDLNAMYNEALQCKNFREKCSIHL